MRWVSIGIGFAALAVLIAVWLKKETPAGYFLKAGGTDRYLGIMAEKPVPSKSVQWDGQQFVEQTAYEGCTAKEIYRVEQQTNSGMSLVSVDYQCQPFPCKAQKAKMTADYHFSLVAGKPKSKNDEGYPLLDVVYCENDRVQKRFQEGKVKFEITLVPEQEDYLVVRVPQYRSIQIFGPLEVDEKGKLMRLIAKEFSLVQEGVTTLQDTLARSASAKESTK